MNSIEITSMSTKGQVVIPSAIRRKLQMKGGSKLIVIQEGENILLKPRTTTFDWFNPVDATSTPGSPFKCSVGVNVVRSTISVASTNETDAGASTIFSGRRDADTEMACIFIDVGYIDGDTVTSSSPTTTPAFSHVEKPI